MSFEKWFCTDEPKRSAVTVFESRLIRFDPEVARRVHLKPGERVALYFDTKRKLIGIRHMKQDRPEFPRIRVNPKNWSVRSPKFFKFWDIEIPGEKRFFCRYDPKQKMAIIDLRARIPRGRPHF